MNLPPCVNDVQTKSLGALSFEAARLETQGSSE